MRIKMHEFEERMDQVIVILCDQIGIICELLCLRNYVDMHLKLKSELDDCHHLLCTERLKQSMLYLSTVWSESPLFDSFFLPWLMGLYTEFRRARIAPASSLGLDKPPHSYEKSRQSIHCLHTQCYEGSVKNTTSPNIYMWLNMHFLNYDYTHI